MVRDSNVKNKLADTINAGNPATDAVREAPVVIAACAELGRAGIYDGVPANQVTNYVTNPTATGWGTTFGGRPVVRLPLYGSGSNLTDITAAQVGAVSTSGVTSIIYSNSTAFDPAGTAAAATNGINAAFIAAKGGLTNVTADQIVGAGGLTNVTPAAIVAAGGVLTTGATMTGSLAFGTNSVVLGTNSISLFGGNLNGTNGIYFVPLASTNRYWILGGN